ncbi:TetR/AcrR family transcriptional regulator [Actinocorallia longicatena]
MKTDGRLLRGEQTRRLILRHAMDIASVDGLEGLSIGRLATDLGISKSGLFAHFGSKEELQLATVAAGREVFQAEVVEPARALPPGIARVRALLERWMDYAERRIFPGGCIIYAISAEFDARPGRIRDAIAANRADWQAYLERSLERAVELGELPPDSDVPQLAFELESHVLHAVGASLLYDSAEPFTRARAAVATRLAA